MHPICIMRRKVDTQRKISPVVLQQFIQMSFQGKHDGCCELFSLTHTLRFFLIFISINFFLGVHH